MKKDDVFSTTYKIAWQRNIIDDYVYIYLTMIQMIS